LSFFSSAKAKLAASKLAEEQLYAQAAEEVASGQIRQGLWAKAIAETGGDEAAAKAHYLKLRVEIMKAEAEVTDFAVNEAAKASEQRERQASAKAKAELQKKIEEVERSQSWTGDNVDLETGRVVIIFLLIGISAVLLAVFAT